MADFLDSEAEESELDSEDEQPTASAATERKKKRKQQLQSDDEDDDDEDDEERLREELKDLIDDAPIEESASDGEDSDASGGPKKRKKSDDELDDRLEDEDYDLIEENLGVKVERKKFKRLRRIQDDESDGEQHEDDGLHREVIAEQLFDGGSDEEDERRSERSHPREPETFDEEGSEGESDADDFIVDDDGRPIAEKKKKRKPIFNDAHLQEGQDIFGVDFDYDEFEKYEDDEYEEDEDISDYDEDEDGEERARRAKKSKAKRPTKKSIYEIYEPSELKRGHFTDLDNIIRTTDVPERMQIREIPITPTAEGSDELDDEAEWIYRQAFTKPTISQQDVGDMKDKAKKGPQTIGKIRTALDYMRNQVLEVPFIAFYRKEYVQPELNINDLWKIYRYDAKWCQLKSRKENLLRLFEKMRNYQLDQLMLNPDAPIPDNVRIIKDDDIERLKKVQTTEELKDVHMHFLLYYSPDIPKMQEAWKTKEKEKAKEKRRAEKLQALEQDDENNDIQEIDDDAEEEKSQEDQETDCLKQANRAGPYSMCRKAGLDGLVKKFGLTPEQFAENLRDNYQRHEVEQDPNEPLTTAQQFVSEKFSTASDVLHAAKYMAAMQLAKEPLLRFCIREVFYERSKINVVPTKKGLKDIDENHPCYGMKFIKNKPVRDLSAEQYLKLVMAEEDKLLTITLSDNIEGNTSSSYLEEIKQLFHKDEFAKNVQDWNSIRAECVSLALNKMVFPDLRKELHTQLLAEARECVLKACCRKLYNWLKVSPYTVEFPEEDDDDWDTSKGVRVLGLSYVPDFSQAAFCCVVDGDSDVVDHLRLPHLLKRKNSYNIAEKRNKEADLNALRNFIFAKKPHVVVIGGESRDALMVKGDVTDIINQLIDEEQFPNIPVEIVDNHLAKIYANSNKGMNDFREYPDVLRQAISLARGLQDPLVEYSQLCTVDEEILCLRFHPLQDQIPKEELIEHLYLEFVNRTNEVGVDINVAVQTGLTANLIQFICGLGPRKGQALIKVLKQTNQRLENRTQLVTVCHMGPKVFINCSGFIKIDTNSLGDSTEAYVEVLDGSRVHPETYEWARKMAVDALEYEDEDANPAGALEEILEAPERLKDLDLDAFAEELERQGFGNKSITLYDIRAELNCRYKDLRVPYRSANPGELFDMLTKETPETLYIGKMVLATVSGISHRKPPKEKLDQANPVRNHETGMWQCQFCKKNDFPELSEVWNHFDAGACPGQAVGVRIRLDNGLSGYIHVKNLSDKHVDDPAERVRSGQTIHCRVINIDVVHFSVECSSKSSDLLDKNHEWRPVKDPFYDQEAEDKEIKKETDAKQNKQRQQYTKRVIVHPAFQNISFSEAEKIMANMTQGEAVIRPSSKGADHLTVTWKVTDGINQHIDVREEGKENAFSLGRSLWIGGEEFEDLDEIIARYVTPMASHARDLLSFKYYRDLGGIRDKAEEALREEKKKNSNKIHYFISAAKSYPGKFMLSYLPVQRCRHEYITVTPEGFRFRQQMFDSVGSLLRWFKEHFKDPIPGATPATPRTNTSSVRTPYQPHTPNAAMSSEAIQRVAQTMPSHMLHSLSQAATYPHTPGNMYINTPYTPSAQTPQMTPYGTPHHSTTPRLHQTPSDTPNSGTFLHPGAVTPRRHQPAPSPHQHYQHMQHYGGYGSSTSRSAGPYNNEPMDWQKAAEAWARSKNKDPMGTPRSDGRSTPKSGSMRTPRYDDSSMGRKTPQYMDIRNPMPSPSGRISRQSSHMSMRSPRSVRSTPHTNTSPRSMSLGDATPLYDEN